MLVLDVYMRIHLLLDASRRLPDSDATIVDACWRRCGEVRLFQNLVAVRP